MYVNVEKIELQTQRNSPGLLTLCLPRSPICTSVNVPRSPICTVIHTPIVHAYCSMKRLPLFLVRTVCMRYQFGFLEFSIRFTGKNIQRIELFEHSTSKCRPNSSVPQNNVAHGGFVLGKQRVKIKIQVVELNWKAFKICNGKSCRRSKIKYYRMALILKVIKQTITSLS